MSIRSQRRRRRARNLRNKLERKKAEDVVRLLDDRMGGEFRFAGSAKPLTPELFREMVDRIRHKERAGFLEMIE